MLNSLDFRLLVTLFCSLGPAKKRELALFSGVNYDTVESWDKGTMRPDSVTERHIKHFLLSKLSDLNQLQADKVPQEREFKIATEIIGQAEARWDEYLSRLGEEDKADVLQRKRVALSTLRDQLGLPRA